jgi:hypothetical protein
MKRQRLVSRASFPFALAALIAACDRRSAPSTTTTATASAESGATPTPAPPAPAVTPVAIPPALAAGLRDAAITRGSYARGVLWSWTTREQAEVLRRDKTLLLDTQLPSGPTPYVELLTATASGDGPYADLARVLLLHPSLRLRRYAWTRPWPTRLGAGDHDYGDQLLRVVLAPRAIVARFDPSRPDVFELHDLDERPVPIGAVLSDPSRLAAVVHVRTDPDTAIPHREVVLCNESMVAEWSLGTGAERDAVAEDIAVLTGLRSASIPAGPARPHWTADVPSDASDAAALFAQALAFDSDRYRSSPASLDAIADALRRVEAAGPGLTVTPSVKFAIEAVVPRVRIRRPPVRVARVV